MSTPAPPRPPGALQNAQQQLDELDALISRMLTLPGNLGEESGNQAAAPAAPAAEGAAPPHRDAALAQREAATAPPAPAPQAGADVESAPEFMAPPLRDPLEVEFRPVPFGTENTPERDEETLPPAEPFHSDGASFEPDTGAVEEEDAEPLQPALALARPAERGGALIRVNQAFDRLTYPFGSAGYWLRSSVGRDVLGWAGVTLLVGSAAWALLDWLGWTW